MCIAVNDNKQCKDNTFGSCNMSAYRQLKELWRYDSLNGFHALLLYALRNKFVCTPILYI